jgi:hypothetical protein
MTFRRPRQAPRRQCRHGPPRYANGTVFMDWRDHQISARPRPCRICRTPALMRDCTGTACHKTCAEAEAARDLALAARRYARGESA